MINHLLADRYARALSLSIDDVNAVDAAAEALREFVHTYESTHDLRTALTTPAIPLDQRLEVLNGVIEKLGMPEPVAGLLRLVLSRGRITLTADIAACFEQQTDVRLNRIGAVATSAVALPEVARARLKQSLEKFSGKQVRIEYVVDRRVVGGVSVRMGGLLLDGSLRRRLKGLADALLNADVPAEV